MKLGCFNVYYLFYFGFVLCYWLFVCWMLVGLFCLLVVVCSGFICLLVGDLLYCLTVY